MRTLSALPPHLHCLWLVFLLGGSHAYAQGSPADPFAGWENIVKQHYADRAHFKVLGADHPIQSTGAFRSKGNCFKNLPTVDQRLVIGLDKNRHSYLFQNGVIEVFKVVQEASATDLYQAITNNTCFASKRYSAIAVVGTYVFTYDATCSEMRTPFVNEVVDLLDLAAMVLGRDSLPEGVIFSPCGSWKETKTTPIQELRRMAKRPRKQKRWNLPQDRESAKARARERWEQRP